MAGIGLLLIPGTGILAATASPPALNSGASSNSFTTATTTAIPSGGSGSYSYAWSIVAGTGGAGIAATSAATAATAFSLTGISPGELNTATARCVVTDTSTLLTTFADVTIRHFDQRTP